MCLWCAFGSLRSRSHAMPCCPSLVFAGAGAGSALWFRVATETGDATVREGQGQGSGTDSWMALSAAPARPFVSSSLFLSTVSIDIGGIKQVLQ